MRCAAVLALLLCAGQGEPRLGRGAPAPRLPRVPALLRASPRRARFQHRGQRRRLLPAASAWPAAWPPPRPAGHLGLTPSPTGRPPAAAPALGSGLGRVRAPRAARLAGQGHWGEGAGRRSSAPPSLCVGWPTPASHSPLPSSSPPSGSLPVPAFVPPGSPGSAAGVAIALASTRLLQSSFPGGESGPLRAASGATSWAARPLIWVGTVLTGSAG